MDKWDLPHTLDIVTCFRIVNLLVLLLLVGVAFRSLWELEFRVYRGRRAFDTVLEIDPVKDRSRFLDAFMHLPIGRCTRKMLFALIPAEDNADFDPFEFVRSSEPLVKYTLASIRRTTGLLPLAMAVILISGFLVTRDHITLMLRDVSRGRLAALGELGDSLFGLLGPAAWLLLFMVFVNSYLVLTIGRLKSCWDLFYARVPKETRPKRAPS